MTLAPKQSFPRVVGTTPLGVQDNVTKAMVRDFYSQLKQRGRSAVIKSMRFIPASRATLDGGFQVVVNTLIEERPRGNTAPRAEALESVVTVADSGGVQRFQALSIPAFKGMSA